jgi:hypothetical protein
VPWYPVNTIRIDPDVVVVDRRKTGRLVNPYIRPTSLVNLAKYNDSAPPRSK